MFSHSARWSRVSMQSSPNKSESASKTTRPAPRCADTITGALGIDALGWVRASTRAPLPEAIVVARYRQAARTRASTSPSPPLQIGEDPARRAVVALVVLHSLVLEPHAEPGQQLVEV